MCQYTLCLFVKNVATRPSPFRETASIMQLYMAVIAGWYVLYLCEPDTLCVGVLAVSSVIRDRMMTIEYN